MAVEVLCTLSCSWIVMACRCPKPSGFSAVWAVGLQQAVERWKAHGRVRAEAPEQLVEPRPRGRREIGVVRGGAGGLGGIDARLTAGDEVGRDLIERPRGAGEAPARPPLDRVDMGVERPESRFHPGGGAGAERREDPEPAL